MSCLGVHFAITAAQAKKLLAAKNDEDLVDLIQEEIEEDWDEEWVFQTDKAWDALHRCLSDGTLDCKRGAPPLNFVFFGGRVLNTEPDYFVVLLTPSQVRDVATALCGITAEWMRKRYFDTPFPDYQGEKSAEDWEYAWSQFEGLPAWFERAAVAKRHVIFTVDQ